VEHLVAVDVAGEHGGDVLRQVGAPDHVRAVAEGVVSRPAGRPLHALVDAEQPQLGGRLVAAGGLEERSEARADVGLVREPGEGHPQAPGLEPDGARLVEHVEALLHREERKRQARPLVVPGHEEHGDAGGGDAAERRERGLGEPGRHAAPVEEVAAVDHRIDLPRERRLERLREAAEEVLPAPAPLHPRAQGQVEAEVGVREEEDPHRH
jgi:hypothetical protein